MSSPVKSWVPGQARDDGIIVFSDREKIAHTKQFLSEEGYLNISARIARTGLQDYYGHELHGVDGDVDPDKIYKVYRSLNEVFDETALKSFSELPITVGHPDQAVDSSNYKALSVGHVVGIPVRDQGFVRAELTIRDAEAIETIKNGQALELSVGYLADVVMRPGVTPKGEAYDAVQKNIRGNHIALVDAARCGPECRIGDQMIKSCNCASCQNNKEHEMSEFVTLDGEQVPLAEAVQKLKDANQRMAEALKDAEATIESLSTELETKSGEVAAMKAEPTQDAHFSEKVRARAALIADAEKIGIERSAVSDLSDTELRRQVIDHVYGAGFVKGASDSALIGMYKVATRDLRRADDTLNGKIHPTLSTHQRHQAEARRNQRLACAWQKGA